MSVGDWVEVELLALEVEGGRLDFRVVAKLAQWPARAAPEGGPGACVRTRGPGLSNH